MWVIIDVFSYISPIWRPIETTNTYLKYVRLTGSNSTNAIEMLKRIIILEPFLMKLVSPEFDFLSTQQIHYLKSVWVTGSNSTNNIEIVQKLIILEPFYEIRNILDICA